MTILRVYGPAARVYGYDIEICICSVTHKTNTVKEMEGYKKMKERKSKRRERNRERSMEQ